jgi:5-bromo-4-chloroindolyl phosphate hydrolysis protein
MSAPAGNPPGRSGTFRWPSLKGFWLFYFSTPLLFASILSLGSGNLSSLLANGSSFALIVLGALSTRRGMLASRNAPVRRYGRRARLSQKNLGGGLVAVGTGIAALFGAGHGLAISMAFAGAALLAFHLLYGLDPLRQTGVPLGGTGEAERVRKALAEAERRILGIEQSARAIGNPELRQRLARISQQGREILALIERRPRDLRRARKFLSVYLEGAQQVSAGYARTHQMADSRDLEQNFRTVLVTIEDVFEEQQQRLLETDVMDLDVQIEVLTKQLEREGIL